MSNQPHPESVAAAIPPLMAKLDEMAARSRLFAHSMQPKFEAEPAFIPCEEHPDVPRLRDWEATLQQSHQHEEFRMAYAGCPLCAKQKDAEEERRYWAKRGVPSRLSEATLDNFIVEGKHPSLLEARNDTQEWLCRVKSNGGFLILLGNPGLGKGHLAVASMKCVGRGLYITHPDLLTELRASYTTHTTEQLIEKYRHTPFLVLDELGVSGGGKDEQPLLYQILSARHDSKLATVITSNEELPTLKDILGHRIMDRIREDYMLCYFKGESHRSKKQKA